MSLLADGLLILASLTSCIYCYVLKRRLVSFNDLQGGIGATIAQMTSSIRDMEDSFEQAKTSSEQASKKVSVMLQHADALSKLIERAEAAKISLESAQDKAKDPGKTRRKPISLFADSKQSQQKTAL